MYNEGYERKRREKKERERGREREREREREEGERERERGEGDTLTGDGILTDIGSTCNCTHVSDSVKST